MIAFINILYKTTATFNYLDDQFEDDLDVKITIIYIVLGLLIAVESIFEFGGWGLKWILLLFIIGAGLGLIVGKYVISYLIYWIGKLLKGKSEIIDIQAVVAYSLIPRLLELPIVLYLGLNGKYGQIKGFELHLLNGFYIVMSILTIKILIQGLMRFNGYRLGKAILNISPFILLGLLFYLKINQL